MNTNFLHGWWIVYERCPECSEVACLSCRRDRHLTLRAIESYHEPPNAIVGPCATKEQLINRLGYQMFKIGEDGEMYFHIEVKPGDPD